VAWRIAASIAHFASMIFSIAISRGGDVFVDALARG
jgi:hypothetical protein